MEERRKFPRFEGTYQIKYSIYTQRMCMLHDFKVNIIKGFCARKRDKIGCYYIPGIYALVKPQYGVAN